MEFLIQKGASEFVGALGQALEQNSENAIKILLTKIQNWNLALITAILWEDLKLVEFVLEKGGLVTQQTIRAAFKYNKNNEITKLILNKMHSRDVCYAICKTLKYNHSELAENIYQTRKPSLCDGMEEAARQGNKEAIDFFIVKCSTHWKHGLRGAARGGRKDLAVFFMQKGATNLLEAWDHAEDCVKMRRNQNKDPARWRQFIEFARETKEKMSWQEWSFNYILTAEAGREVRWWMWRSWMLYMAFSVVSSMILKKQS